MNINNIESELKFVNQLGITINTEERLKLELVIQNLKQSQNFEHLLFWGKIEGTPSHSPIIFPRNPKRLLHRSFPNIFEPIRIPPKTIFLLVFPYPTF